MHVRTLFKKVQNHLASARTHAALQQAISLTPSGPVEGHVLLSYFPEPFGLPPGQAIPHTHSNYWESFQIAQTFLACQYAVDVISDQHHVFTPHKPYAVLIDSRHNLQRLAPLLPADCGIATIQAAVQHLAQRPAAEIQQMARAHGEYARATYTRDKYAEAYRAIVQHLLQRTSPGGGSVHPIRRKTGSLPAYPSGRKVG